MIHDYIAVQPLNEIPIDPDGDFVESDMAMDDSDDSDDGIEERMEGLIVH